MTDETLAARVDRLIVQHSLTVKDRAEHLAKVESCFGNHLMANDDTVLRRIYQAGAEPSIKPADVEEPRGQPVIGQDVQFTKWLAGLAAGWPQMDPAKKINLHREYLEWQAAGSKPRENELPRPIKLTGVRDKIQITPALAAIVNPVERMQAAAAMVSVAKLERSGRNFDQIEANRLTTRRRRAVA